MRRIALALAALIVAFGQALAAGAFVTRTEQSPSGTIPTQYYDMSGTGVGPFLHVYVPADGGGNVAGGSSQATGSVPINISTATTTRIVQVTAGKSIKVTGEKFLASGTTSFSLVYGTGANCGTGTGTLDGPYSLKDQGGASAGAGNELFVPAGNDLCVQSSAAVQVGGSLSYTQF